MRGLKFLDRRLGFSLGALSILIGVIAPAAIPAFASADSQITSRSIQMSSSAESATGVSYDVTFTPATSSGSTYIVLFFCGNTPLIGSSCTAPAGMSLSSATVASPGTLDTTASTQGANFITLSATLTVGTSITIPISAITNPSGASLTNGTFYGRIETFDTQVHAEAAATGGATTTTGLADDGGVALEVTPVVGVTASVLESMTFCVFGDPNNNTTSANGTADASTYLATQTTNTNGPVGSCDDTANSSPSPSVQLGQVSSGVSALSTATVSYAADWAQLSTNASSGAIVYLKTSNQCVGLHRTSQSSATTCDIPSAGATTNGSLAAGTAGFGLAFGPAVSAASDSTGSIELNNNYANASGYYSMLGSGASTSSGQTSTAENGLVQDTTSTYGGFVFGSAGAPVADQDVPFALGATIGNNTPAGSYTADLSLIAVGTF